MPRPESSVAASESAVYPSSSATTLELAEALSLGVGDRRQREEALFLVHRGPEALVAHHDDVDGATRLVGKLVLLQDGRLLRPRDRAGVGLEVAGEDLFMKVDLLAPFGPVRPKWRPSPKVTVTSSKSRLAP